MSVASARYYFGEGKSRRRPKIGDRKTDKDGQVWERVQTYITEHGQRFPAWQHGRPVTHWQRVKEER